MDIEETADIILKILDYAVSFVKGEKNYVKEVNLKPNSKQIIQISPGIFRLYLCDKNGNLTDIAITTLFGALMQLKKSLDANLITQNEFDESKREILKNFSNNSY